MLNKIAQLAALPLVALPTAVLAHPGHDHSHWTSEPIHLLTLAAIIGLVSTSVVWYRKRSKSKMVKKTA